MDGRDLGGLESNLQLEMGLTSAFWGDMCRMISYCQNAPTKLIRSFCCRQCVQIGARVCSRISETWEKEGKQSFGELGRWWVSRSGFSCCFWTISADAVFWVRREELGKCWKQFEDCPTRGGFWSSVKSPKIYMTSDILWVGHCCSTAEQWKCIWTGRWSWTVLIKWLWTISTDNWSGLHLNKISSYSLSAHSCWWEALVRAILSGFLSTQEEYWEGGIQERHLRPWLSQSCAKQTPCCKHNCTYSWTILQCRICLKSGTGFSGPIYSSFEILQKWRFHPIPECLGLKRSH